ncbi:MAG: RNA polymerase sigma factor SigY [Paenibacillaceae bacterium]
MEEQVTIELAQQGDTAALARLLQEHYPFVLKYLVKITFDPHWAEDLAQETMLKCIHKIKLYNGQSQFSSWLITIATRIHIDHLRRRQRELNWQDQEINLRRIKFHAAHFDNDWPTVLEALGSVSANVRTAIILKHYYGYSLEEIATMMDAPVGTIKSRIHNGITIIRKEMTDHDE